MVIVTVDVDEQGLSDCYHLPAANPIGPGLHFFSVHLNFHGNMTPIILEDTNLITTEIYE